MALTPFDIYLSALTESALNRRTALHQELAVAQCVFFDFQEASPDARATLSSVYEAAGYDCGAPGGLDYKTINRRINVAAKLFGKLGMPDLRKVTPKARVAHVMATLAPLGLQSVNDVLSFCGKQVAAPRKPHAEVAGTTHVKAGAIDVALPPTTKHADVMHLIQKLLKFAEGMSTRPRKAPAPLSVPAPH